MELTRNQKYMVAGVAVVAAFGVGRYTVSEKVKIVERIVEVEKKQKDKDTTIKKKRKKKTTIIVKPDGSKETVIEDDTDTDTNKKEKETTDKEKHSDKQTEREKGGSQLTTISLLGGYRIGTATPVYGLSLYRPVLWNFGVGVWGLSDSTLGASVGISF